MIHDIRQHSTHYAILAGYLGLMLIAFMAVLGNETAEASVIVLTGLGYVVWGIGHHFYLRDLSSKIVAEYVLMAILIIIVLIAVLLSR